MGDYYIKKERYDTEKAASKLECEYMDLVGEMFNDIRNICINLEDPKQVGDVVMNWKLVEDSHNHYKTWIVVQDVNSVILNTNVQSYTSTLFRIHIEQLCDAFTMNILKHSTLYVKYVMHGESTAIPEDIMEKLVLHLRDTSVCVKSLLNASVALRDLRVANSDIDLSEIETKFTSLVHEHTIKMPHSYDVTSLETQWHAIGRLADIVARLAQSKDETRI
jgi:hypothetical protein